MTTSISFERLGKGWKILWHDDQIPEYPVSSNEVWFQVDVLTIRPGRGYDTGDAIESRPFVVDFTRCTTPAEARDVMIFCRDYIHTDPNEAHLPIAGRKTGYSVWLNRAGFACETDAFLFILQFGGVL